MQLTNKKNEEEKTDIEMQKASNDTEPNVVVAMAMSNDERML